MTLTTAELAESTASEKLKSAGLSDRGFGGDPPEAGRLRAGRESRLGDSGRVARSPDTVARVPEGRAGRGLGPVRRPVARRQDEQYADGLRP